MELCETPALAPPGLPVGPAPAICRFDDCETFGEGRRREMGRIEAKYLMPLALAHAGRLEKYGA